MTIIDTIYPLFTTNLPTATSSEAGVFVISIKPAVNVLLAFTISTVLVQFLVTPLYVNATFTLSLLASEESLNFDFKSVVKPSVITSLTPSLYVISTSQSEISILEY